MSVGRPKGYPKTGGRKKGVTARAREEFVEAFHAVASKRQSGLQDLIDSLWDLAIGTKVEKKNRRKSTVYSTLPDVNACKFLIEQYSGRAPQRIILQDEEPRVPGTVVFMPEPHGSLIELEHRSHPDSSS